MENQTGIAPFQGENIRKEWHKDEWYFSVVDIIEQLTESSQPSRYWADLKKRAKKEAGQSFDFCERLPLPRQDGRKYPTDCANTEGVLRIIQSVPSPKAEPFRMWLAKVGKDTLDLENNPELGFERIKEIYRSKGYPDEWIERRLQSIEVRKQLTDEWKMRGIKEGQEFGILTATVAKGTFGLTPSEHAALKGLEKENLRDNMTPLELILTAFGEEVTRQFTIKDDAQGFNENHEAAQRGGSEAGKARENLEKQGLKVVSEENFKHLKQENLKNLKEGEE